ncbi:MAG TPA: hypothetical protein VI997_11475 [Candidatus Thermoplasmatota archaeon]|nr:hypothetical protein [Candidatus Thermoplasmatota archaeon]
MLYRLQAIAIVLIGFALSLAAGSRLLVERLGGSTPWTLAAVIALISLVGGVVLVAYGIARTVRR